MWNQPAVTLGIGLVVLGGAAVYWWPDQGIRARLRRARRRTGRILGEDTLKFMIGRDRAARGTSPQAIAGALGVDLDRAAGVIDDLVTRGLIAPRGSVFDLTPSGREAGLHLVRAHRLWEVYLSQRTGYEATEWHARADAREHDLDSEGIDRLARKLGHPAFDPDGDPIPDGRAGSPVRHRGTALSAVAPGAWVRVVHVEDEPQRVYSQLIGDGIGPGAELEVLSRDSGGVRVRAHGGELLLSPLAADHTAVVPADDAPRVPTFALSEAAVGQPVEIERIAATCRGAERRRLLDLGLVRGTVVVPELRSPGGDPTAYRVRETLVALRAAQADAIRVMEAHR